MSDTNTDTVEVTIHGWASVGLSTTVEVEPVYNDDGSLDQTATLQQVDNGYRLAVALNNMDSRELDARLDIESDGAEIVNE